MSEGERSGAERVMLMAALFAIPVLKLSWTLGGGSAARDALGTMGPENWLDVMSGMFLLEPLLSTVLGVAATRTFYVYLGDRGRGPAHPGRSFAAAAGAAAIVPGALALAIGSLNGWAWGLTAGALAYALRLGAVLDFRAGRYAAGHRRLRTPGPLRRTADAAWAAGLLLTLVVLPCAALAAALDGRSWTGVVRCDVNTGSGPVRTRLIELEREGDGVVGWAVAAGGVVNGVDCAGDEDDVIREPWWRA
ncbi:hypothetical protein ACFU3J_28630 [Streptomyces sp. NPDC057411]|uniref:hypothetical protein n=1 Tax=unclassified Streptomyces TaxID=2593676 RepID=UPI0036266152